MSLTVLTASALAPTKVQVTIGVLNREHNRLDNVTISITDNQTGKILAEKDTVDGTADFLLPPAENYHLTVTKDGKEIPISPAHFNASDPWRHEYVLTIEQFFFIQSIRVFDSEGFGEGAYKRHAAWEKPPGYGLYRRFLDNSTVRLELARVVDEDNHTVGICRELPYQYIFQEEGSVRRSWFYEYGVKKGDASEIIDPLTKKPLRDQRGLGGDWARRYTYEGYFYYPGTLESDQYVVKVWDGCRLLGKLHIDLDEDKRLCVVAPYDLQERLNFQGMVSSQIKEARMSLDSHRLDELDSYIHEYKESFPSFHPLLDQLEYSKSYVEWKLSLQQQTNPVNTILLLSSAQPLAVSTNGTLIDVGGASNAVYAQVYAPTGTTTLTQYSLPLNSAVHGVENSIQDYVWNYDPEAGLLNVYTTHHSISDQRVLFTAPAILTSSIRTSSYPSEEGGELVLVAMDVFNDGEAAALSVVPSIEAVPDEGVYLSLIQGASPTYADIPGEESQRFLWAYEAYVQPGGDSGSVLFRGTAVGIDEASGLEVFSSISKSKQQLFYLNGVDPVGDVFTCTERFSYGQQASVSGGSGSLTMAPRPGYTLGDPQVRVDGIGSIIDIHSLDPSGWVLINVDASQGYLQFATTNTGSLGGSAQQTVDLSMYDPAVVSSILLEFEHYRAKASAAYEYLVNGGYETGGTYPWWRGWTADLGFGDCGVQGWYAEGSYAYVMRAWRNSGSRGVVTWHNAPAEPLPLCNEVFLRGMKIKTDDKFYDGEIQLIVKVSDGREKQLWSTGTFSGARGYGARVWRLNDHFGWSSDVRVEWVAWRFWTSSGQQSTFSIDGFSLATKHTDGPGTVRFGDLTKTIHPDKSPEEGGWHAESWDLTQHKDTLLGGSRPLSFEFTHHQDGWGVEGRNGHMATSRQGADYRVRNVRLKITVNGVKLTHPGGSLTLTDTGWHGLEGFTGGEIGVVGADTTLHLRAVAESQGSADSHAITLTPGAPASHKITTQLTPPTSPPTGASYSNYHADIALPETYTDVAVKGPNGELLIGGLEYVHDPATRILTVLAEAFNSHPSGIFTILANSPNRLTASSTMRSGLDTIRFYFSGEESYLTPGTSWELTVHDPEGAESHSESGSMSTGVDQEAGAFTISPDSPEGLYKARMVWWSGAEGGAIEQLFRVCRLSVRLRDADGRPLSGALAHLEWEGEAVSMVLGSDGGLARSLIAGSYGFRVVWHGVEVLHDVYEVAESAAITGLCRVSDLNIKAINRGGQAVSDAVIRIAGQEYIADGEGMVSLLQQPFASYPVEVYYKGMKVASTSLVLASSSLSTIACNVDCVTGIVPTEVVSEVPIHSSSYDEATRTYYLSFDAPAGEHLAKIVTTQKPLAVYVDEEPAQEVLNESELIAGSWLYDEAVGVGLVRFHGGSIHTLTVKWPLPSTPTTDAVKGEELGDDSPSGPRGPHISWVGVDGVRLKGDTVRVDHGSRWALSVVVSAIERSNMGASAQVVLVCPDGTRLVYPMRMSRQIQTRRFFAVDIPVSNLEPGTYTLTITMTNTEEETDSVTLRIQIRPKNGEASVPPGQPQTPIIQAALALFMLGLAVWFGSWLAYANRITFTPLSQSPSPATFNP